MFQIFFMDDFLQGIVKVLLKKKKCMYAVQKGKSNFQLSVSDVKAFIGITILNGYAPTPVSCHHMYWEEALDIHNIAISCAICRNCFDKIVRDLYLNDNK